MGSTAVPGLGTPGLLIPGYPGGPLVPSPGLLSAWTAAGGAGPGSGIPLPPSMPLECPVSNTGAPGNGMVAFVSWAVLDGYLGCDMAVSDDAHSTWFPLGAPAASSPAAGLTRCAIWAAPGAFAAKNVYAAPCGLPGPCYPVAICMTVIEISAMSPYLGTPAVVTAAANAAASVSASTASPGALAIQLAVGASDGTVAPTGPGGSWTAITGATSPGAYDLSTSPAWQVSSAAETATWTASGSPDLSAASAVILVSNPAPWQPSPDWPAFAFLAGLGSGALTPPGQISYTDLTYRWLAGAETSATTGKQYELDELEAAENVATFDDDDGSLTAGNPGSQYYPDVTADVPLRLLAWWDERTYGVMAGFAERWPVTWDEDWYGITECTFTDAWSLQQNQLTGVLREETGWDPNLYAYWPCSDPAGSSSAQNIAPGNTSALQVVTSKNGALTATQSFGNDSGLLPGDQSGTFWQQAGLTSGANGYGYCLYCADQGYPSLTAGITVTGWFSPTGGGTQIENTDGTLILMRGSSAATGPVFQVWLESPSGANPGAICVTTWDVSSGTPAVRTVYTADWLQAGVFHIALEVTTSTWELFVNGASAAAASGLSLAAVMSWLEFMGAADRFGTGSMLNGECAHLAVFGVQLTADRVQSIWLAGAPSPATIGGGTASVITGAQFAAEYPAQRMERLLAYGGWTGPRSISQSSVTQMAPVTDIQGDTAVIAASGQVTVSAGGQQAAEAANNIVFSDGGFAFTDGNGTLCYLSRGDLYVTPPQWVLGENTPAADPAASAGSPVPRGGQGFATSSATATQAVTFPGSVVQSDLLLIWCACGGSTAVTWSCPGFTPVPATTAAAGQCQLLWKIASPADAASALAGTPYTVTASSGVNWACAALAYGQMAQLAPFDPPVSSSGQVNASSATVTVPGIATAVPGDQLVWLGFNASGSGSAAAITPPAGFTVRSAQATCGAGTPASAGVIAADMVQEAAGATGSQDGSLSVAHGNGGLLVAVTAPQEIPYLPDASLGYDKSLLYNGAELTPSASVSGAPVVASDLPSIAAHGEYVYNATAYQYLIAQVTDEAQWIVNTRGEVTLRAESLTADAMANPDVWPFLLGVQPAQPVIVHRRPQTATYEVVVYPVTCQVVKALDFQAGTATVKIATDEFAEGTVLTAGDPVLGVADGTHALGW